MKKLIASILLVMLSFLFPGKIHSQDSSRFFIDSNVTYKIQYSGSTQVEHDITITNGSDLYYAKSFSLSLSHIEPKSISVTSHATNLKFNTNEDRDKNITSIDVQFDAPTLGNGSQTVFQISYISDVIAQKSGEVWEISIPRLEDRDQYRNYAVSILTPKAFGMPAFISPDIKNKTQEGDFNKFIYGKDDAVSGNISAAFGAFQVYSFGITYHLENSLAVKSTQEISIPPDTENQKAIYSSLDPRPDTVRVDTDGNYLASYTLNAHQRIDIQAKGVIQVYPEPREFVKTEESDLQKYLVPTKYWQSEDPKIEELAQKLKTPQAIYDYVSTKLKYDYDRVQPNVERLGALGALDKPNNAICMEFTDLFIAIARAAGIPAREINGYAYTENPKVQPLSLVADVLHAWPEYWNASEHRWVQVDPTWGSTTGGEDFFTKLDLRHVAFVIHGSDPEFPYPPGSYKLGTSPQKDVYMNISKLPSINIDPVNINMTVQRKAPIGDMKLLATIETGAGTSTINSPYTIYFDDKSYKVSQIPLLPPYAKYIVPISVPFSVYGSLTPEKVSITFGGKQQSVQTYKNTLVIVHVLITGCLLSLLTILLYFKVIKKMGRYKDV